MKKGEKTWNLATNLFFLTVAVLHDKGESFSLKQPIEGGPTPNDVAPCITHGQSVDGD